MALADMVIVIVEIADVVLKQMKDNVITATFKVVYMSSSFWLSAVESRDLSQAEKKIPAFKAEQINKMTTIFSQNDNLGLFCEFTQLNPTNQWDPTANWRKLEDT